MFKRMPIFFYVLSSAVLSCDARDAHRQDDVHVAAAAVELVAVKTQMPRLRPYRDRQIQLLLPHGWHTQRPPNSPMLLASETGATPAHAAELLVHRYPIHKQTPAPPRLARRLEQLIARQTGLQPHLLEEHQIQGGVLRISRVTVAGGSEVRLVVLAAHDPANPKFGTSALLNAPAPKFTALGGSDFLTIVAGSARRPEEKPAVELLDPAPRPSASANGLGPADLKTYIDVLQQISGRALNDAEQARLRQAAFDELDAVDAKARARQIRATRQGLRAMQAQLQQATGKPHYGLLRWLLQEHLLAATRAKPLAPGAPLTLRLLSERRHYLHATTARGQAATLNDKQAWVLGAADGVLTLNVAKAHTAPLLQDAWRRLRKHLPTEAQTLLTELRTRWLLPDGSRARTVLTSWGAGERYLHIVLGAPAQAADIAALLKRRAIRLEPLGQSTPGKAYRLHASTLSSIVELHTVAWGHVLGDRASVRALFAGSERPPAPPADAPLLRTRTRETLRTYGVPQTTPVQYVREINIDVDRRLRIEAVLYYADARLAQAAHGFYLATEQSAIGKLRWQRDGKRLTGVLELSPAQAKDFLARLERHFEQRARQQAHAELMQAAFEYFLVGQLGMSMQLSTGAVMKGMAQSPFLPGVYEGGFGVPPDVVIH